MEQKNDFSLTNIQLKDELGAGTFGKVYSGYLKSNGMKIAFKRISKKKISSYGQFSQYLLDALKKEFECMKMCNCENSVRVYNFLETGNNYNFVMELCDNDLSNELKKRPNGFDVDEVRNIMSQLNNAFKKMVEHNIIHRDLKLGNILITYTDETKTKFKPKLCDYGFSKVLNDSFTQTHLGTPATMAPEIMSGKNYGPEVDLWSIGILMYQLHFNKLPYTGKDEKDIYQKIKNKVPYEQPEDPDLRDLINNLLIEDPKKRLFWPGYFNHPFFKGENKDIIYIGNSKRYIYQRDFDVGFKSDMFKCCVALDTKKNKKVLIKSYNSEFINSHKLLFKLEYHLHTTFIKNEHFLQLINIDTEKNAHLIFDYVDCEILPSYMNHNEFDENKLQILNKELIEKVFNYSEINLKPFIFISIYSFAITTEGKPILFDFGLNKFFLPTEEAMQYYLPNKMEIAESLFPLKTNVMNYGITLLKIYFGNNLKLNLTDNELFLPDSKNMSDSFKMFISKCLKKDINKRNSWQDLKKQEFIQNLQGDESQNIGEKQKTLISDKKLKGIFRSLDSKYNLINKYYESLEINDKTPFCNEIEYFLILTLFEQLTIFNIFNKTENNKYPDINHEISFVSINEDKADNFKINFGNPLLKNMKIFNSNNKVIEDFLIKLKKHIIKLKEISLRFHKITKSNFFKGNYYNFLREFSKIIIDKKFKDYFFSLTKETNNDWLSKNYEKAKMKAPIAEYLSETVVFIIISIVSLEKEKIYFQLDEFLKKFNEIFEKEDENDIQVSCVKLSKGKEKYILITFLGVLFKYLINSMNMNEIDIKRNKSSLSQFLGIYQKLMKTLVDIN